MTEPLDTHERLRVRDAFGGSPWGMYVTDADPDPDIDCGPGIHVSTASYWNEGDTLIGVKVHVDDVLACQSGKIRCRRAMVLGVCS